MARPELGLKRDDVEDDLAHALRSARAAGRQILVVPARCRSCGFTFDEERLSKPGKCPACRGTAWFEPQISVRWSSISISTSTTKRSSTV